MESVNLMLVSPPSLEPVSLAETKLHLRVDGTSEDTLIGAKISAARELVEGFLGRALLAQTWRLSLDRTPSVLTLPLPPLRQVISVTLDGVLIPAAEYQVDVHGGRIIPLRAWSSPRLPGGLVVEYVAGYGALMSDVPSGLREVILQTVGHLYENREAQGLPEGVKQLLRSWRVMWR